MATFYANAITGNDANDGTSWALAKKTLASAYAAAAVDDTIYLHGRFTESLTIAKRLIFRAEGYACLDGGGAIAHGLSVSGMIEIHGLKFTGFSFAGIRYASGMISHLYNCDFVGNVAGMDCTAYASHTSGTIRNCVFRDNTSYAIGCVGNSAIFNASVQNCVFINNPAAFYFAGYSYAVTLSKCLFNNGYVFNAAHHVTIIQYGSGSNIYNVTGGGCKWTFAGVEYTTLASYVSLVGSIDVNPIDSTWETYVGDSVNGLLRPIPSSYLLTAASDGDSIGLTLPAVTVSNTANALLWTGGVFSNTEIDGSGYLVLSAGQTSGYWRSDIIDFGAAINAKMLEVSVAGEDTNNYLDYDTGDSPGYFNARVRGSNVPFLKTDVSPAWVTVPRRAEIGAYMSNALRYWQVELTLRGP